MHVYIFSSSRADPAQTLGKQLHVQSARQAAYFHSDLDRVWLLAALLFLLPHSHQRAPRSAFGKESSGGSGRAVGNAAPDSNSSAGEVKAEHEQRSQTHNLSPSQRGREADAQPVEGKREDSLLSVHRRQHRNKPAAVGHNERRMSVNIQGEEIDCCSVDGRLFAVSEEDRKWIFCPVVGHGNPIVIAIDIHAHQAQNTDLQAVKTGNKLITPMGLMKSPRFRLYDLSKDEKHRSKRKRHRCRNSRSVNKKKREDKNQHNLLSTKNRCIHSTNTEISQSVSGLLVTSEKDVCLKEGGNEYDSGNDTCSPPSIQISSSQLMVNQDKESLLHHGFQHASTSGKTPNGHSDNISDSGNSSASCFSFMKDTSLLLRDSQKQKKRILSSCQGCLEEQKISNLLPDRSSPQSCRSRSSSYSTRRSKSRSPSHSVSSYYSRHRSSSGRKSRSRSSSSEARSYSRSRSYSSASGRKSNGSRSSRARRSPSYSRYSSSRKPILSFTRDREKSSKYGSTEKSSKGVRRRRRSSYTPLRKRRRDSPSHLEARRITSARKRPIPYYRPSPSSSSGSSTPSWYRTCSRSRSRSFFSHRSSRSRSPSSGRSRSRDWSRSSREHSRSRSWSRSSDSCNSTRR
ncbi:hypothetical protein XELAEV_18007905mg [Xenopus laevis]|uniref:Serine/arginine repetitive matrix protein C-terminal domain-containing protein n=1 Tax=Xenopus laevis TaxID=8355 RepID=A0A974E288_XENLA|nr:hypothetical protein XELAEV_18007905mg [Xenopus laevis]